MNPTARRKQFVLLFCGGLASVLVGGYAGEAAAQVPLRVDPVLLGLPPVPADTPGKADKAAAEPSAVSPVAAPSAETRPVVAPVVEVKPQNDGLVREQRAVSSAVPAAGQDAAAAKVVSTGAAVSPSGDAPPAIRPQATSQQQDTPAPVSTRAAPPPSGAKIAVSALAPLRVDPALLGLPPAVPALPARTEPALARSGTDVKARTASEAADAQPALALRVSAKMEPLAKDSTAPRPTFLAARRMDGEIDREFRAEGAAELRRIGTVLNADRLTYWPLDDEVEAEGQVRLEQNDDVISGPKLRLRLEDQVGYFEQPEYVIRREATAGSKAAADKEHAEQFAAALNGGSWWNSGFATPRAMSLRPGQTSFKESTKVRTSTESHGAAERIYFEGENQVRLTSNTYSTCPVGNDDWYIRSDELKLDYDSEVGEGRNSTVYFKDVPILYSPWLSFPLNNRRKSGFLAPSIGTNSDNGFEYEQPYYWNIAPNMDATIAPRLMSKRGVQVNNEFRYLNAAFGGMYHGKLELEVLPGDRLRDGDTRYGLSLRHDQKSSNGFTGLVNFSKVSDDDYYTDLSSSINRTSQTQLLQQGMLTYGGGGWWSASVNLQQYQTLQPDAANPVLEQYRMLPQITVNARKPDLYLADASFLGQYTNFTMRKREQFGTVYPDGQRTVLYPQIALPYVTPGWYVTPKFGVNYRSYALSGQASGTPDSFSMALPVFSIDAGMTFERTSNWFGRDYTQTLEPRLYYLNIPYKDQSKIPLFDTALADFNFAQIFSENQFSSWDRLNNANQLTAALTSRLIEPATGNEIVRAMVGQRFYFTKNRVSLSGTSTASDSDKWDRSDFLMALSGQILPKVYVDSAIQFDLAERQAERYSVGVRYQPEPGKVLNAAYRYNRDATAPINQVDVSGQWPLFGRWHGVGRVNYSFKDDGTVLSTGGQGGRIIESIAGLEYDGGCWVLRGVVRRQALTSADASTAFFIQLELSDFGRIGSNPLGLLKRNIQGYGLINQPNAESAFDD